MFSSNLNQPQSPSNENSIFRHYANTPSNPITRPKHISLPSVPSSLKSPDFTKLNYLLDNLCKNTLDQYYQNSTESEFKTKFDKLNLKFYLETEKYLNDKCNQSHCQTNLFVLLFKQINLCIQEIAKLNNIIQQHQIASQALVTQIELVSTLKQANLKLEKRLANVLQRENKLLIMNEKLNKQLRDGNNYHMKTEVIVNDVEEMLIQNKNLIMNRRSGSGKIRENNNRTGNNNNQIVVNSSNNNGFNGNYDNNSFNSVQNIIKTIKINNNYKKRLLNNNTCLKQKYEKETV